jgi:hypothetical protein
MTGKRPRLSWWRADNATLYEANTGRGGYVIELGGGHWNVDHRRGPRGSERRQLGKAATVENAKAIAEQDFARDRIGALREDFCWVIWNQHRGPPTFEWLHRDRGRP